MTQKTGYGGAELHLNAPVEGRRVTIIDDVLSTGGTLRAMCSALRAAGALPVAIRLRTTSSPKYGSCDARRASAIR